MSTVSAVAETLGVINFVQVVVGILHLLFLAAAAAYVAHQHRASQTVVERTDTSMTVYLRLALLLSGFVWVCAALVGDDALWHVMFELRGIDDHESKRLPEHDAVCLAQKTMTLGLAEPAFLMLIAQIVSVGESTATATAASVDSAGNGVTTGDERTRCAWPRALIAHPIVRAIGRPLAVLLVVQTTLVFTERWLPVGVIFVATSQVPSKVCIVPTANLIVSTIFAGGFIVYFNLFCVRLSRVLISRQIKGRLWSLQVWHTTSLPLILALRLLLIIGFGFATRAAKHNAESFLPGLLLSRFLLDLEFFVILFSVLLSVHSLVWRPLREVHTLRRHAPSMRILQVDAAATSSGAMLTLDDISCDTGRPSLAPVISRRSDAHMHPRTIQRARPKYMLGQRIKKAAAAAHTRGPHSPHPPLSEPPAAAELDERSERGAQICGAVSLGRHAAPVDGSHAVPKAAPAASGAQAVRRLPQKPVAVAAAAAPAATERASSHRSPSASPCRHDSEVPAEAAPASAGAGMGMPTATGSTSSNTTLTRRSPRGRGGALPAG